MRARSKKGQCLFPLCIIVALNAGTAAANFMLCYRHEAGCLY